MTSTMPNGLVALPGHSGQIPSAIILPNGQVIPVVTSNNSASSECSTVAATAVEHTGIAYILHCTSL